MSSSSVVPLPAATDTGISTLQCFVELSNRTQPATRYSPCAAAGASGSVLFVFTIKRGMNADIAIVSSRVAPVEISAFLQDSVAILDRKWEGVATMLAAVPTQPTQTQVVRSCVPTCE